MGDSFRIDGAKALVTGASRGIGRAAAVALARAGADVAVAARSTEALKNTVVDVETTGQRAVPVTGDLAGPEVAERLVGEAAEELGGLDVVVANAGVVPTDEHGVSKLVPFTVSTDSDWQPVTEVNLHGTVRVLRAAYPYLAQSQRASVTIVSSVAGIVAAPGMEPYAASKAAQISLARSLSAAWAEHGIRVNALCPGWVATDMTGPMRQVPALSDWLTAHVPQRRWLEPGEIAPSVVFLSSPAAAGLTGQVLTVDGGLSVPDGGLAGRPKPPSPFAA